jgi:hypothetical protein
VTEERKREIEWGVLGVGGVIVIFVLTRSHTATPQGKGGRVAASSSPPTVPNPGQPAILQAIIAARTNALDMYDTSVLGEKSAQEQEDVAYNSNLASKQINASNNATTLQADQLASQTEEAITNLQTEAQEQEEQSEESTEEAMQPQWWQTLLGGLFGGGAAFATGGASMLGAPGYGYGSGGGGGFWNFLTSLFQPQQSTYTPNDGNAPPGFIP